MISKMTIKYIVHSCVLVFNTVRKHRYGIRAEDFVIEYLMALRNLFIPFEY